MDLALRGTSERRGRGARPKGATKGAIGPPSLWKHRRGDALDCLTLAERNALVLYASAERIDGRLVSADLKALAMALGINASNLSNRYRALSAETAIENEIVRIRGKVERAAADRVRSRPVEPDDRPRTYVPTADERKELEMEDESRRGLTLPTTESSEESLAEAERQVRQDLDDRDARKAARLEEIEANGGSEDETALAMRRIKHGEKEVPISDEAMKRGSAILTSAGDLVAALMTGDSGKLESIAESTLVCAIDATDREIRYLEARRERLNASLAGLLEGRGERPSDPENGDKEEPRAPEPEPEIEPETAGETLDVEMPVPGENVEILARQLRPGMAVGFSAWGVVEVESAEVTDDTVIVQFETVPGTTIYEKDESVTAFVPEEILGEVLSEKEAEPDEAERLDEKEEAGEPEPPPPAEKLDEKEAKARGGHEQEKPTTDDVAVALMGFEIGAEIYPGELRAAIDPPVGDQDAKAKRRLKDRLIELGREDAVECLGAGRGTKYRRLRDIEFEDDGEESGEAEPEGVGLRLEDVRDWIVQNRKDGRPFFASEIATALSEPGALTTWNDVVAHLATLVERGVIEENEEVGAFEYVRRAPDPNYDGRKPKERIPGRMHRRSQPVPGTGRKLVGTTPR